jgi:hypothetical protein
MYPYFAMLALPSGLAINGTRGSRFWLLLIGLLYFLMIGFRFRVGMDWNNYLDIYRQKHAWSLARAIFDREPGYNLLIWVASNLRVGMIFVDAVSALVFCWGFFGVAKRCREPWIAVTIATPLLVVAFAMTSVRQAIAAGIIFHLISRWDERRTLTRLILVMLASTFHFSAIFMMIFVALGSRTSHVVRIFGAAFVGTFILVLVRFSPSSVEAYSRLYLVNATMLAPGAIFQVAPLAIAALIYLMNRDTWIRANGANSALEAMAWAAVIAVPAIGLSSAGTYRFALYLWPMAMIIYSGVPGMIESGVGRLFFRICIVVATVALLMGWLLLANNSYAWLPYQNWLFQPDGIDLLRRYNR